MIPQHGERNTLQGTQASLRRLKCVRVSSLRALNSGLGQFMLRDAEGWGPLPVHPAVDGEAAL